MVLMCYYLQLPLQGLKHTVNVLTLIFAILGIYVPAVSYMIENGQAASSERHG